MCHTSLFQIYSLPALNNSWGIGLQLHKGVPFVVVQATANLVWNVELQPIIEQVQCSQKTVPGPMLVRQAAAHTMQATGLACVEVQRWYSRQRQIRSGPWRAIL